MTCREVEKVADLFVDGELEARAMRAVAMHITRCPLCEALIQRLERLQDVIGETFHDAVASVDFSRFWAGVSARAGDLQPSLLARWSAQLATPWRALAVAAAVAVTVGGVLLYRDTTLGPLAARANNQVRIDSLVADADSVALLSEPQSNTTVIWVESPAETAPR
jgi:anti-sigma factor RsiW